MDVFAITGDGGVGLWIASSTGLDHLDTVTGVYNHVGLAAGDDLRPQARRVQAVLRSSDGTLWVGTEHGLERS